MTVAPSGSSVASDSRVGNTRRSHTPAAIPLATYRLQFGAHAGFDAAAVIAPYLAAIGISHLYASPWFEARGEGSHGYDITDFNAANPVLGGNTGLDRLCATLAQNGLGHIADFVPNHMGIGKTFNPWWSDVLAWGQESPHAAAFDIDWNPGHPHLRGKVEVPILGKPYGQALENGDLVLRFDADRGRFAVWYFDHRFPINPRSYPAIIAAGGQVPPALAEINRRFEHATPGDTQDLESRLARLAAATAVKQHLRRATAVFVGKPGDHESHRSLHDLLERQCYRLSYWRTAQDEINYRHFFNIADLAGIRVEKPDVFASIHGLVGRLLRTGVLAGLRIDHIDGLHDPRTYCERLRDMSSRAPGGAAYIVVEKILAADEALPKDWPVAGTTGYDFLTQVNALLVDPRGEKALTHLYGDFAGRNEGFEEVACRARRFAVTRLFGGDLDALVQKLHAIGQRDWSTRDHTVRKLHEALLEILCRFPVYRTYITADGASDRDRSVIMRAVTDTKRDCPALAADGLLDFVAAALSGDHLSGDPEVLRFAMRFQQASGPIAAKGIEDTAFYRYNRLIVLNEVGGDPGRFGLDLDAFHRLNRDRAAFWPHGMLATATHDTKRGEDARARLAVLSERPAEWHEHVLRWSRYNRRHADAAIDPNDEYLLYQALIGAWPVDMFGSAWPAPALARFRGRITAFMRKAVREAGEQSSWAYPDEAYENALDRFIAYALDREKNNTLPDMAAFAERIAALGVANSLAQLVLKCTCPGLPDIYQGTELWDLSLVDPDNRAPADFAARSAMVPKLKAIGRLSGQDRIAALERLTQAWPDGRIKFFVLLQLLALRQDRAELFTHGSYEPLKAEGEQADRIVAFRRVHDGQAVTVIAARHRASLPEAGWGDTALPSQLRSWRNIFDGRTVAESGDRLPVAEALRHLPAAVLVET